MSVQVGGREVTHTFSLILKNDESARIGLAFPGDPESIALEIKFVTEAGQDGKPPPPASARVSVEAKKAATLIFTNWGGALGMATTDPWRIGSLTSGKSFGIYACVWTIGTVYRADLQFMTWGEGHG